MKRKNNEKKVDFPGQYELSKDLNKEKQSLNFNKVRPLNPLDNKPSPIKSFGQ